MDLGMPPQKRNKLQFLRSPTSPPPLGTGIGMAFFEGALFEKWFKGKTKTILVVPLWGLPSKKALVVSLWVPL